MTNVGTPDRIARLIVGVALIALALTGAWPALASGWAYWVALIVGVVMAVTALTRFCPLYTVLGINTCGVNK